MPHTSVGQIPVGSSSVTTSCKPLPINRDVTYNSRHPTFWGNRPFILQKPTTSHPEIRSTWYNHTGKVPSANFGGSWYFLRKCQVSHTNTFLKMTALLFHLWPAGLNSRQCKLQLYRSWSRWNWSWFKFLVLLSMLKGKQTEEKPN